MNRYRDAWLGFISVLADDKRICMLMNDELSPMAYYNEEEFAWKSYGEWDEKTLSHFVAVLNEQVINKMTIDLELVKKSIIEALAIDLNPLVLAYFEEAKRILKIVEDYPILGFGEEEYETWAQDLINDINEFKDSAFVGLFKVDVTELVEVQSKLIAVSGYYLRADQCRTQFERLFAKLQDVQTDSPEFNKMGENLRNNRDVLIGMKVSQGIELPEQLQLKKEIVSNLLNKRAEDHNELISFLKV